MSFQGNGCQFPLSFHFVNDKSYHGEIEPSRGRVELDGQFDSLLDTDMELKLAQIDDNGASFGIFRHFSISL